jgi:predicted nucleic acid-binding protein
LSRAFVDSSCILALQLAEASATDVRRRLAMFSSVYSASLLEAEVLSAISRERRIVNLGLLDRLQPIYPDRSLRAEIEQVLDAGYVRGADCLHLATALYLTPDPAELTFLTLDERQRAVAVALGFAV